MMQYLKSCWTTAARMSRSGKGEINVGVVVTIFVAILLAGKLLPTAFDAFFSATTTGWDSTVAAIWPLIPLFAVLAVAFYFWRKDKAKGM